MAHREEQEFCQKVRNLYPQHFFNKKVLDIGSLDVNGTNRFLFTACDYIGLDLAPGLNVDVVCAGHAYQAPDEHFDTIICTEVFEHDMHYEETLKNIVRMLKPGGLFVFTCAGVGRPEHGTRRSEPTAAPLLPGDWADYYKNLTPDDINKAIYVDFYFINSVFEIPSHKTDDLYFYGVKR